MQCVGDTVLGQVALARLSRGSELRPFLVQVQQVGQRSQERSQLVGDTMRGQEQLERRRFRYDKVVAEPRPLPTDRAVIMKTGAGKYLSGSVVENHRWTAVT